MATAHRIRKTKAVGIFGDLAFYYVGSQLPVRELLRRPGGSDVGSIQIYFVTRLVSWGRKSSLVVVTSHVIFCLAEGCLCFFKCQLHPVRELVNRFYLSRLFRFEAHPRVLTGIEKEGGLLSGRVDVVVVLEFRHGQKVCPVVLPLTSE